MSQRVYCFTVLHVLGSESETPLSPKDKSFRWGTSKSNPPEYGAPHLCAFQGLTSLIWEVHPSFPPSIKVDFVSVVAGEFGVLHREKDECRC